MQRFLTRLGMYQSNGTKSGRCMCRRALWRTFCGALLLLLLLCACARVWQLAGACLHSSTAASAQLLGKGTELVPPCRYAKANTSRSVESCGILAGVLDLEADTFSINTLIVPKQVPCPPYSQQVACHTASRATILCYCTTVRC